MTEPIAAAASAIRKGREWTLAFRSTPMAVNWDSVVSAAYQELIPTLSTKGLLLFGALLALAGLVALRAIRG